MHCFGILVLFKIILDIINEVMGILNIHPRGVGGGWWMMGGGWQLGGGCGVGGALGHSLFGAVYLSRQLAVVRRLTSLLSFISEKLSPIFIILTEMEIYIPIIVIIPSRDSVSQTVASPRSVTLMTKVAGSGIIAPYWCVTIIACVIIRIHYGSKGHLRSLTYNIHYSAVIMGAVASQITSLTIVYSTVYSGADKRKHQSSAWLAFVREFTGDQWIPAQRASDAENVSIWCRHHQYLYHRPLLTYNL